MTKADLVQEISKQTGIDRDKVLMIVEAFSLFLHYTGEIQHIL